VVKTALEKIQRRKRLQRLREGQYSHLFKASKKELLLEDGDRKEDLRALLNATE
jgi:hypothetical protein